LRNFLGSGTNQCRCMHCALEEMHALDGCLTLWVFHESEAVPCCCFRPARLPGCANTSSQAWCCRLLACT
jgi:hypothetical protein